MGSDGKSTTQSDSSGIVKTSALSCIEQRNHYSLELMLYWTFAMYTAV
jgi:hypothetical protein